MAARPRGLEWRKLNECVCSFPLFIPLDLSIKWNFNISQKAYWGSQLTHFCYLFIKLQVMLNQQLLICSRPCTSTGTKSSDDDDDFVICSSALLGWGSCPVLMDWLQVWTLKFGLSFMNTASFFSCTAAMVMIDSILVHRLAYV